MHFTQTFVVHSENINFLKLGAVYWKKPLKSVHFETELSIHISIMKNIHFIQKHNK